MLFILTHITKYLTLPPPNWMDRLHPLVCPSGFPRWCAPWTSVVDKSVVGVAQVHALWGGESLLTRRNVQGRGLGSGRHTFIRLRRRRGALLLSRGRRPIRPVTPRRAPRPARDPLQRLDLYSNTTGSPPYLFCISRTPISSGIFHQVQDFWSVSRRFQSPWIMCFS